MGKKILLVEDEQVLSKMIAMELRECGADVLTAYDGQEAMELMEKVKPDLVLLDIVMPRKDGFAVLEFVQKKNLDFPVVMLTNLGSKEQEEQCRKLGAADFLIKSELDTGDILNNILRHLS